jgi:predicted nucleic acid-binding protein
MVLADTSIWIDHIRQTDEGLSKILAERGILIHPLVIEELACGTIASETLALLHKLQFAPIASHAEVMALIKAERLAGTGIGAIDAHLLASARLAKARLWSRDKALHRAAERLHIQA